MTVEDKVKTDLKKAIKSGSIDPLNKPIVESFKAERRNYYGSLDKMDKGGRLAVLDFLYQFTHGPLGIIDFIVFHPIKTFKAVLQIFIIVAIIYVVMTIYQGGDFSFAMNLFKKFAK